MGGVEYVLSFCRLCLKEEDLLDTTVTPDTIEGILNVKIYRSDDVPPFICKTCNLSLDAALNFADLVRKTQETLAALEKSGDLKNDPSPLEADNEEVEMVEEILDEEFIIDHEEAEESLDNEDEKMDCDSDAETLTANESETEHDEELHVAVESITEEPKIKKIQTVLDGRTVEIITQPPVILKPTPPLPKMKLPPKPKPELNFSISKDILYEYEYPQKRCASMTDQQLQQYTNDNERINSFYTFNCPICRSIAFDTFAQYKLHMRKAHKERLVPIYCCKRKLTSRTALLEHIDLHLNPEKLSCPKCGRVCRDSRTLQLHIMHHTDPNAYRFYECNQCSKRCASQIALQIHEETHLPKEEREKLKILQCPECDKKYSTKSLLNTHIKTFHQEKYATTCNICDKRLITKSAYTYHMKHAHSENVNNRPFRCQECNVSFISNDRLKGHIKRNHVEVGSYSCEKCDREFSSLSALRGHKAYAHQHRKYECEECGKFFKVLNLLKEHKSAFHGHGVPLYKCNFCEKTFNSNANMYNHRKKMHPDEHLQLVIERRGMKVDEITVD